MSGIVGSKFNIRGSGLVAKLGTDGQHMLSSGAGVSANYETIAAAGGAWEYIARQTLGSDAADIQFKDGTAATDGTPDFGSDYSAVMFHMEHWTPATDNVIGKMIFSTDTGSSYPTGSYLAGGTYETFYSGVSGQNNFEETDYINLTGGPDGINNDLAHGLNGFIWVHNTSDTAHSTFTHFHLTSIQYTGVRGWEVLGGGCKTTAQDTDAVQFLFTSGNVLAGSTIRMYGLKAS